MMNPLAISVIIPLYNVEKYVGECLDSILAQTFQNFEVIVVNDCSTDKSRQIVESYLEKFGGRLKIFDMEKNSGGCSLPRNKGFYFSRGEYIFFMDADDVLTKTAFEELYTPAKKFDADVVCCEKFYQADQNIKNVQLTSYQKGNFVDKPTFETENLAERFQGILQGRFMGMIWLQLVLRDFLIENKLNYPPLRGHEDTIHTWALIFCAKKFLRIPNAVYVYRLSDNSITRKKNVTPAQKIDFNAHMIIEGVQAIRKITDKVEFFRQNPLYLYTLLDYFLQVNFNDMFKKSLELQSYEIYEIIKQEFGDKLGEQDVLVSALLAVLNEQQKFFLINAQNFNQFAMQAQNRIKELEAQLADSRRRVVELESNLN